MLLVDLTREQWLVVLKVLTHHYNRHGDLEARNVVDEIEAQLSNHSSWYIGMEDEDEVA